MQSRPVDRVPPSDWSDEQVLALADLQLPAAEDERLSILLERQQEGPLSESEKSELGVLIAGYQSGLLRKASGLREAVRRGLRQPLEP